MPEELNMMASVTVLPALQENPHAKILVPNSIVEELTLDPQVPTSLADKPYNPSPANTQPAKHDTHVYRLPGAFASAFR